MVWMYYLAFIGLILGAILAFFVKEELKPGQKYFKWLKKIVLIVIIVMLVYFSFQLTYSYLIAFAAGILISWVFKKYYFYLGVGLLGSSLLFNDKIFIALIALIFILGFPVGTLQASKLLSKKSKLVKIIVLDAILFSLPLLLLLYGNVVDLTNVLMIFSAGALLHLVAKK